LFLHLLFISEYCKGSFSLIHHEDFFSAFSRLLLKSVADSNTANNDSFYGSTTENQSCNEGGVYLTIAMPSISDGTTIRS